MVTAATAIQFQHFPALHQPTDLPTVPSRVTQRPTGRPGLIGDAEQAEQVAALLSLLSGPEKKSSRAKQRVGARYSLYKYGGQQEKEQDVVKKTKSKFGARYSLYKYDGPEKKEDKTFRRVNSINARQSLYKSREEKLERFKVDEKAADFKAQPLPLPQEKDEDVNAFNVSIGGERGRQEYKVSANRSRQRRRKLGLRTDLVEKEEEKEEVRRESEEMKRVGELVRRRLGEELRRIFREELEGKTEDMLKEKQEEQEKEEEKERSRQQARRKDEGEEEFEQNSLETIPPLSTAGRLMAPQITIRKRLALPLYSNEVDESRRGERERQESEERDGERQQEAEARSDVDEEEERQKYFRRLWSLRQARVSARLKKGRNGAHQNVQKKHQHHHQRRYQRQNGQKKQKYDTGPRRIVQNSLESRFLA